MTDTKLVAGSTLAHSRALRRIVREVVEMERAGEPMGAAAVHDASLAVDVAVARSDDEACRKALVRLGALVVAWLATMEDDQP